MRPVLLATVLLGTLVSAALADPTAPTGAATAADPNAPARLVAPARPAGPVELSDDQMDRVAASGTRVGSAPGSRDST